MPRLRAFTLVECLLATSVLSVAVLAVAQALTAGQAQTYEALHQARAMQLAKAMMEEVLAQPRVDPQTPGSATIGPEAGESSRAQFDDADDYHGYSEALGQLKDATGSLYPVEFQRFTRQVAITAQTLRVANMPGVGNGLSVLVTVTDTRGQSWTLTRFIPR